MKKIKRFKDRSFDQLRPVSITCDPFGNAVSSVLFELGNTKVFCAITLQPGVPNFLRGSKTGWLTAEYAMLPTATTVRMVRDSTCKRNGRSVEISRLIGRVLRTMVDLKQLGERTIIVDCDVLHADGGTRTACITAASFALRNACARWIERGNLENNIIKEPIAAVSVGIKDDQVLLDLDYSEDIRIDADYNFAFTQSGNIVEIQGSAEQKVIPWDLFDKAKEVALKGIKELCRLSESLVQAVPKIRQKQKVPSLFSIKNRLHSNSIK